MAKLALWTSKAAKAKRYESKGAADQVIANLYGRGMRHRLGAVRLSDGWAIRQRSFGIWLEEEPDWSAATPQETSGWRWPD